MKLKLGIAVLVIAAFFTGRFFGRLDGPRIVTSYMEPPIDWRFGDYMAEPAFDVQCSIAPMKTGISWKFSNLEFDMENHTVTGRKK